MKRLITSEAPNIEGGERERRIVSDKKISNHFKLTGLLKTLNLVFLKIPNQIKSLFWSMECGSMVSIASLGPGDPGSNLSWFAVSNSN